MAEASVTISWTQEEWTNFLISKCCLNPDKAAQIAVKFVQQEFSACQFGRVVNLSEVNPGMSMQLLQAVGFSIMDIFPFIDALKQHVSKEAAKEVQTADCSTISFPLSLVTRSKNKRGWLCNELVFEICPNIPVLNTGIVLTAQNIYVYLAPRFRKMLVYRELIDFIQINAKHKSFRIKLVSLTLKVKSEQRVIHKESLTNKFELKTDQLWIRVATLAKQPKTEFVITGFESENAHLLHSVRLVAKLVQPKKLDVSDLDMPDAEMLLYLEALIKEHRFDWIQVRAKQFASEQLCTMLAKYDKLHIELSNSPMCDWPQFCHMFLEWLNGNGQSKQCLFSSFFNKQKLTYFLDAVKADFSSATSEHPFSLRFCRPIDTYDQSDSKLNGFNLKNGIGEVLELRGPFYGTNDYYKLYYTLVRRPVGEMGSANKEFLEARFEEIERVAGIVLM